MVFLTYAWLIPLLPLLGFLIISLTPIRRSHQGSGWLAIGLMALSMVIAIGTFSEVSRGVYVDDAGNVEIHETAPHSEGSMPSGALFAPLQAEEPEGAGFSFPEPNIVRRFDWALTGSSSFQMGYYIDPSVAAMLAMVTITSTMIHLFSLGYMSHDPRQSRFFSFISLFTAGMLGMTLADNLLLFFMAWEIMGLCSFLLIGFWFERPTAYRAAAKAFITTRIGDVLMMVGMAYLYTSAGSLAFGNAEAQLFNPEVLTRLVETPGVFGLSTAGLIALLIFAGTVGKSAQFPLHVWLPDAMEGPTPVSALIHAATMVAAGVFLVARLFPLFEVSGILPLVAFIGAFTALFAALIAVAQYDIKRILAFSTLSQLGFMVAALGIGAWVAALFHLLTHAFFKALLFLGSGSIIHGMEQVGSVQELHHKDAYQAQQTAQDVRNMGDLRRLMPWTFFTYITGYLALAGIPPFAGFFSKDEILADALTHGHLTVFAVLAVAAFLTAFYMTRQIILVFFGQFRGNTPLVATVPFPQQAADHDAHDTHGHSHNSHEHGHSAHDTHDSDASYDGSEAAWHEDWRMTMSLVVLATFAVTAGFFNLPAGLPAAHWFSDVLRTEAGTFSAIAAGLSVALALAGIAIAVALYRNAYTDADDADPLERLIGPALFTALNNKLYIDELYSASVGRLSQGLAWLWSWIDRRVLDPIVDGTGRVTLFVSRVNYIIDDVALNDGADALAKGTVASGDVARRSETGRVQDYVWLIFAGAALLAVIYLYAL